VDRFQATASDTEPLFGLLRFELGPVELEATVAVEKGGGGGVRRSTHHGQARYRLPTGPGCDPDCAWAGKLRCETQILTGADLRGEPRLPNKRG